MKEGITRQQSTLLFPDGRRKEKGMFYGVLSAVGVLHAVVGLTLYRPLCGFCWIC